jgi:hypothetical protein
MHLILNLKAYVHEKVIKFTYGVFSWVVGFSKVVVRYGLPTK